MKSIIAMLVCLLLLVSCGKMANRNDEDNTVNGHLESMKAIPAQSKVELLKPEALDIPKDDQVRYIDETYITFVSYVHCVAYNDLTIINPDNSLKQLEIGYDYDIFEKEGIPYIYFVESGLQRYNLMNGETELVYAEDEFLRRREEGKIVYGEDNRGLIKDEHTTDMYCVFETPMRNSAETEQITCIMIYSLSKDKAYYCEVKSQMDQSYRWLAKIEDGKAYISDDGGKNVTLFDLETNQVEDYDQVLIETSRGLFYRGNTDINRTTDFDRLHIEVNDVGCKIYDQTNNCCLYEEGVDTLIQIDDIKCVKIKNPQRLQLYINQDALQLQAGDEKPMDYEVSQPDCKIFYLSSNPDVAEVTSDGMIHAYAAGKTSVTLIAIKEGYMRDVRHLSVEVCGRKRLPFELRQKIMLLKDGATGEIDYVASNGIKLDITSLDQKVKMKKSGDGIIEVGLVDKACDTIVFCSSKDGYIDTYRAIPVISLDADLKDIFTCIEMCWKQNLQYTKDRNQLKNEMQYQMTALLSELSNMTVCVENQDYRLEPKQIKLLAERLWNLEQMANASFNRLKINPECSFANSMKLTLKGLDHEADLEIDRSVFDDINNVNSLLINLSELGTEVTLPINEKDKLFEQSDKIFIDVAKKSDGTQVDLLDQDQNPLENLKCNLFIGLSGDEQQTICSDQNIVLGGYYNPEMDSITVGVNQSQSLSMVSTQSQFTDIDALDEDTQNGIKALVRQGVIDSSGQKFRPDDLMTRAEFTSMLIKALYLLDTDLQSQFKDIDQKNWCYSYIASAEKYSLVKGYPDQTFRPDQVIRKEEMLTILVRKLIENKKYQLECLPEVYLYQFEDYKDVSEWAAEDIAMADKLGLISPDRDKNLKPREGVKRSEAVMMIYQMMELLYS